MVTRVAGVPSAFGPNATSNLEGPVWIDGSLYASHIQEGGQNPPPSRILKITGTMEEEFVPMAGTNGLAVNAMGNIVGARHSTGDVAGCEQVPVSDVSAVLGCRACTTPSDCDTNGATCTQGSCRFPLSYVWSARATVTADDALLGARCCPTGRVKCEAPDSEGDRVCKCAP